MKNLNLDFIKTLTLNSWVDQNGSPITVELYGNHQAGIYVQLDRQHRTWRFAVSGGQYSDWL